MYLTDIYTQVIKIVSLRCCCYDEDDHDNNDDDEDGDGIDSIQSNPI